MAAIRRQRTKIALEVLERRDCPAVVSILGDQSISETAGPVTLTVALDAADTRPVVVGYVLGGEATVGRDYRLTLGGQALGGPSGRITFRPGETQKTITLASLDDLAREGQERVTISLFAVQNARIGARTATVTILDDDSYTAWIEGPSLVTPGQTAEFIVRLSSPATQPETICVSTVAGSAAAGTDFLALNRLPLVFSRGQIVKSFRVPVLANTAGESDEIFQLRADPATPGFPAVAPRTITITGSSGATLPSISVAAASVVEGNAGPTNALFTISLSATAAVPVTVFYATADGSATAADKDYAAVAPTLLTFTPGETVKTVGVAVTGDTRPEADETFTLVLSGPTNATLGTATATGTIRDDDSGPPPAPLSAWTIMVYMTGENLNTYARDDIDEMERFLATLPANHGVNIVVSWDQPQASVGTAFATGGGSQAVWRSYGRSVLVPDTATSTIASVFDLSAGEKNTGDPAVLVDFMKWAVQKAPAANYALQFWGHGGGLDGSQFDSESGGDALTINELGSALGAAGVPPLRLVSFDNCLMAMAEVGYAAATRFSGHFVASEELINGTGQDYLTAYAALKSNPAGVTSQALAAGMVASYQAQYAGDISGCDTFSAVATGGYGQLVNALAQFVVASDPLTAADRTTLRGLANGLGFDEPSFRDLGRFMARVATSALPQPLKSAATAVGSALGAMVSAKTADGRSSSGMSIYLPTAPDAYLATYASTATAFCNATGWNRFANWMATGTRSPAAATAATAPRRAFVPGTRGAAGPQAGAAAQWAAYGAAAEAVGEPRGRGRGVSRRS